MENPNDNQASERSYEEALKRLEEIVERLEGGDLTLEESLSLFEEGIGLAKFCNGKLDAAEGRVEMLLGFEGTQPQTGPFKLSGEEE